jgi:hypothetical protein
MSYLQDATDPTPVPQRVWAGVVATDAVDMLDRISVVIGGLNGDMRWEDCHWQPKDNITLPQEGDQCVVIMDDNGELWATGWGDLPTVSSGQWIKGVGNAAVWSDIVAADIKSPVNGQWIKGVGGVSTWQPILASDVPQLTSAQMPGRLAGTAGNPAPVPSNDWSAVTETGWYMGPGVANAPTGDWYIGQVLVHNPIWQVQTLYGFTYYPTQIYTRAQLSGGWNPWRVVQQNFIHPPYQPDFQDYGAPFDAGGYTVRGGLCVIQGLVSSTNDIMYGHYIFQGSTVPAPIDGGQHIFQCYSSQGVKRIDLRSDGTLFWADTGTMANGAWLSLDGIAYAI